MKTFSFILRLLVLVPVVCLGDQFPIPPATISTTGVNASEPHAAVDPNKHIVAVWLENGFVISRSTTAGTGIWSAPTTVSASGADTPRVTIDSNGNATAIWAESGVIKVATKPLAGSWSASTTLSGSGASAPRIKADSSGDFVAVWVENDAIMSSTQLFGGSWSAPDTLSSGSGVSNPHLAVNSSGAVAVVWQQLDSTFTVYAAEKQINASWGSATVISIGDNSVYPHVAIDAAGDVTVAWFQYQFTNNQYYNVILIAAQRNVGQAWGDQGAPVSVAPTTSLRNPADLAINLDYNGSSPIVTWTSSDDGSTFNVEQALFTSMGGWDLHPRLIQGDWAILDTSLAVGPVGNNGTVWMRSDPVSGNTVVEGTTTAYAGFEDFVWQTWIFSNGGNNAYPMVAAGGTSLAPAGIIIWENYNGTNTRIQTQVSALMVVQPPTGVSVMQQGTDYGVFTRYDNVLSWTPSISMNLWGYNVQRNNITIAQIAPTDSSYTDINQDFNAPVTYQIYAIDLNGVHSSVATASFP